MGLKKILVIAVHPAMNLSHITRRVWDQLVLLPGIECYDLYELYPDFYINVAVEQEKLRSADLLVFLYPIYWYGAPSLLKEWQMRVLTRGFAYGKDATALLNMDFWQVVSAGGGVDKYDDGGSLGYSIVDLLQPYEAMARKCKMQWHPPKVLYSARRVSLDVVDEYARDVLRQLLNYQSDGSSALDVIMAD